MFKCVLWLSTTKIEFDIGVEAASTAAKSNHLRGKQQDPASQAIDTLDADRDGVIQPEEVAEFAADQGLDVAAVNREFAGLDSNADGVLSAAEVAVALQGVKASAPANEAPAALLEDSESESLAAGAHHLHALESELDLEDSNDQAFGMFDTGGHGDVSFVDSKSSESLAANIVQDLKIEETQEAQARDLFRKSSEMRSKVISLSESTKEKAAEVSAHAVHEKTDQLIHSLNKLTKEALAAEEKAAAYRAKSRTELRTARELMAAANSALQSRNMRV
mmetsp:Transcript_6876/g.12320  ORF Transcript_6876/g.12320 Transcript_6876/m.12320 type:complete len:277 (-) Transcript_6876:53-883(-)